MFQEVSSADPELKPLDLKAPQALHLLWAKQYLPEIPGSVAQTEDARRSGPKTLILIQDAHTNNSGQLNTAATLDLILSKLCRADDADLEDMRHVITTEHIDQAAVVSALDRAVVPEAFKDVFEENRLRLLALFG